MRRVRDMQYRNLHELIDSSSSSRRFFYSLPIEMQSSLRKHNNYIHTAEELHLKVSMIENNEYHIKLSNGKI